MGRNSSAATPAVSALQRAGMPFTLHPYAHDPRSTAYGEEVVAALAVDPRRVFKTLVASVDGVLTVGVVPVASSLDLKALAAAVGGKRAVLAPVADAERSSGYVAGGISPIGQRRSLRTVVDSSAQTWATLLVSAGRRGLQVELSPADLVAAAGATIAPIAAG